MSDMEIKKKPSANWQHKLKSSNFPLVLFIISDRQLSQCSSCSQLNQSPTRLKGDP